MRMYYDIDEAKLSTMLNDFFDRVADGLVQGLLKGGQYYESIEAWITRDGQTVEQFWAAVCRDHGEEPTSPPYFALMLKPPGGTMHRGLN